MSEKRSTRFAVVTWILLAFASSTLLVARQEDEAGSGDRRGTLGLRLSYGEEGTPPRGYFVVEGVIPGGPAEEAGVREGDEIVAVDGSEFQYTSDPQILRAWTRVQAEDRVEPTIRRADEELTLELTAAPMPEATLRQAEELMRTAQEQTALSWLNGLEAGASHLLVIERHEAGTVDVRSDAVPEDVLRGLAVLFQRTALRQIIDGLRPRDSMAVRVSLGGDGTPSFEPVDMPPYLENHPPR